MKNLKHITKAEAVAMFENYNKLAASGVAFASVSYLTPVSGCKTINKQPALKKFTKINATIGSDYEKKVNRIVENKQGEVINFVAEPQKGKEYYIEGAPVVRDTATGTKRYLVMIIENHTVPSETQYYIADGMKAVNKADVWNDQYMTPSGMAEKEYTSGRGAVDQENNFYFRTVDFANIKGFVLGGTDYRIID